MIDPFKLDDPRLQRGLELIAKQFEAKDRNTLPYYNEETAFKVKGWLDELHDKKIPICIEGSANTVRNKYYQGVKYLIDKIDAKYEDIFRRTRCVTTKTQVELYIRYVALHKPNNTHEIFVQDEFIEFITSCEVGARYYMKTELSQEQIEWINSKLAPLGAMFISSVTPTEIKVIRVN